MQQINGDGLTLYQNGILKKKNENDNSEVALHEQEVLPPF